MERRSLYTDMSSTSTLRPVFIISFKIKPTVLSLFSSYNYTFSIPRSCLKPCALNTCKCVHMYNWKQLAVNPREMLEWGQVGRQNWLSSHPRGSVQERPCCTSPEEEGGEKQEPKNPTGVSINSYSIKRHWNEITSTHHDSFLYI